MRAADTQPAVPQQAVDGSPIYTVSRLTSEIRETLERRVGVVWVTGEVSSLRVPASGHMYFNLKDNLSQIRAVAWRATAEDFRFELKDGISVVAQGEVTVYEPRGEYQLTIRRIEPLGLGALQLAFQQLKEKLLREGLFDAARKRPLPRFPATIAIITSPTGAAIQDMLRVLGRRFPGVRVLVCPVRVQGDGAAREIAAAIALVNRIREVEVMIVGRGGGSLEDLWPFNEEVVARAIASSKIPVISAVGHETDFTISDFVADVRALTPTDAANIVVMDSREIASQLDAFGRRLARGLAGRATALRERLTGVERRLDPGRFVESLRDREEDLDDLAQRLYAGTQRTFLANEQGLDSLTARVESLSPLAVLRRGYSISAVEPDGKALIDTSGLQPGMIIRTKLHKGEFLSQITQCLDDRREA